MLLLSAPGVLPQPGPLESCGAARGVPALCCNERSKAGQGSRHEMELGWGVCMVYTLFIHPLTSCVAMSSILITVATTAHSTRRFACRALLAHWHTHDKARKQKPAQPWTLKLGHLNLNPDQLCLSSFLPAPSGSIVHYKKQ